MSLPTITSFLPSSTSDIDQSINLACVQAIRYALDQTNCQYITGELFIADEIGNQHGICGVFQHHVDYHLSTEYKDSLESRLIRNRLHHVFYDMIKSWPECRKSVVDDEICYLISFPINSPEDYFYERGTNTLWRNPKRIALLNYLIEVANNV